MGLPNNYRESTGEEQCRNCLYIAHANTNPFCRLWSAKVKRSFVCSSWEKDDRKIYVRKES